jgi:hypothetical protein
MDDWWKYLSGIFLATFGFVLKDAVRDGRMDLRMKRAEADIVDLQELYDSKPCATEALCNDRRKDCNNQLRREFDLGTNKFDKLEKCIREVEQSSQRRHEELLRLIMEVIRNDAK